MDDWKGLAPVTLAAEQPVTQFVRHGPFTVPMLVEPGNHLFLGVGDIQTIEKPRVYMRTVADIRFLLHVPTLHDLDDRQAETAGELPVPLVSTRHCHDRAGAISDEDIVRHPDGNRLTGDGIEGIAARGNTGFLFHQFGTSQIRLPHCFLAVSLDRGAVLRRCDTSYQRMFGRQDTIGSSEQSVWPGGEDVEESIRLRE